jgi:hypothetical protein
MIVDWLIIVGLLTYHCFAHYKVGKAFEAGKPAPFWLMSGLVAGTVNCLYTGMVLCS